MSDTTHLTVGMCATHCESYHHIESFDYPPPPSLVIDAVSSDLFLPILLKASVTIAADLHMPTFLPPVAFVLVLFRSTIIAPTIVVFLVIFSLSSLSLDLLIDISSLHLSLYLRFARLIHVVLLYTVSVRTSLGANAPSVIYCIRSL